MSRLWKYAAAAFVFDWLLYIVWTVVPLLGVDFQGTPLDLALIQVSSTSVYIVMSVVLGRLADRVNRPALVRAGCLLMVACCVAIPMARSVAALMIIAPFLGLSSALFWPSIQAAIGAEASPGSLDRDIGIFNVLWSIGKAAGFLTGAALKGGIGTGSTMGFAIGGSVAVILFYPWKDPTAKTERLADTTDPALRGRFLRMSWMMNFIAFGAGATVANQYIKQCDRHSIGLGIGHNPVETFFGILLFGMFMAQTVVFAVAMRWSGWLYRRAPLYASQVLLAAGCAILGFTTDPRVILLTIPLFGIGLGVPYVASITYSLRTSEGHGKFSGLHEAILGSGNLLLPLAAGAAAKWTGDLRWPYWLCAGVALAAILIEEGLFRRKR